MRLGGYALRVESAVVDGKAVLFSRGHYHESDFLLAMAAVGQNYEPYAEVVREYWRAAVSRGRIGAIYTVADKPGPGAFPVTVLYE